MWRAGECQAWTTHDASGTASPGAACCRRPLPGNIDFSAATGTAAYTRVRDVGDAMAGHPSVLGAFLASSDKRTSPMFALSSEAWRSYAASSKVSLYNIVYSINLQITVKQATRFGQEDVGLLQNVHRQNFTSTM